MRTLRRMLRAVVPQLLVLLIGFGLSIWGYIVSTSDLRSTERNEFAKQSSILEPKIREFSEPLAIPLRAAAVVAQITTKDREFNTAVHPATVAGGLMDVAILVRDGPLWTRAAATHPLLIDSGVQSSLSMVASHATDSDANVRHGRFLRSYTKSPYMYYEFAVPVPGRRDRVAVVVETGGRAVAVPCAHLRVVDAVHPLVQLGNVTLQAYTPLAGRSALSGATLIVGQPSRLPMRSPRCTTPSTE